MLTVQLYLRMRTGEFLNDEFRLLADFEFGLTFLSKLNHRSKLIVGVNTTPSIA